MHGGRCVDALTRDDICARLEKRGASDAITHLDGYRTWDVRLSQESADRSEIRAADVEDDDAAEDTKPEKFGTRGYAAVFDSNSLPIWGMFTERIQRGAFKECLRSNPDVKLMVNHEGIAYARTGNDTLTIREEPRGLYHESYLNPDIEADRDLVHRVASGTIDQMSFGFRVARDGDEWECKCGDPFGDECRCTNSEIVRTITRVSELREVSVVTFPAYPSTTVEATRESETTGEQTAQASDEEQREIQAPEVASAEADVSGHKAADAIRAWADSCGGTTHVAGNQGAHRSES
jgi:HK97 family phage prohead protease